MRVLLISCSYSSIRSPMLERFGQSRNRPFRSSCTLLLIVCSRIDRLLGNAASAVVLFGRGANGKLEREDLSYVEVFDSSPCARRDEHVRTGRTHGSQLRLELRLGGGACAGADEGVRLVS